MHNFQVLAFDSELDSIVSIIEEKIDKAEILESPFPHLIIEDFFSENLYLEILNQIRTVRKGTDRSRTNQRFILDLKHDLKESDPIFLSSFKDVILESINAALFKKLSCYIDQYFPEVNVAKLSLLGHEEGTITTYYLCTDTPKYFIETHVDQYPRFFTFLIYLPVDKSHEKLGTTLFYGSDNYSLTDITKEAHTTSFAKRVPYHPNTLVVMLRTRNSWHGASKTPYKDQYLRKLFIGSSRFSKEVLENN